MVHSSISGLVERITQIGKPTGLQLKNSLPNSFLNQIIQDELYRRGSTN